MTKALRKAIMHRSRLKGLYLKNKSVNSWNSYKVQRNFCTNLLRKTKRLYFDNLDKNNLYDTKKFWKTIRPYFSDKGINSSRLFLEEKGELLENNQKIAETLNNYFVNITKTLKLKQNNMPNSDISTVLSHFNEHISIDAIRKNVDKSSENFSFQTVSLEDVEKVIKSLDIKKSSLSNSIPTCILKAHSNTYLPYLTSIIKHNLLPQNVQYG